MYKCPAYQINFKSTKYVNVEKFKNRPDYYFCRVPEPRAKYYKYLNVWQQRTSEREKERERQKERRRKTMSIKIYKLQNTIFLAETRLDSELKCPFKNKQKYSSPTAPCFRKIMTTFLHNVVGFRCKWKQILVFNMCASDADGTALFRVFTLPSGYNLISAYYSYLLIYFHRLYSFLIILQHDYFISLLKYHFSVSVSWICCLFTNTTIVR